MTLLPKLIEVEKYEDGRRYDGWAIQLVNDDIPDLDSKLTLDEALSVYTRLQFILKEHGVLI